MPFPTCNPEFRTILQGEDRNIPLRIVNIDSTPFDLTDATEIRVRMKRSDGTFLEKRFTQNVVSIVSAILGRISVSLTTQDTSLLLVAERQDFSVIVDKGLKAQAVIGLVGFIADLPGIEGNLITLAFDGISTVQEVVDLWNGNNPANRVVFTPTNQSSMILSPQNVTLNGGTSNRRKVNFKRAVTVERQAI